jgi:hypothetical protein
MSVIDYTQYDDIQRPFTGKPIPYADRPATSIWASHFYNRFYLELELNAAWNIRERQIWEKRILNCEKKMEANKRHPNFDTSVAAQKAMEIKAMWTHSASDNKKVQKIEKSC